MLDLDKFTVSVNVLLRKSADMRAAIDVFEALLCGLLGVNLWSLIEPNQTRNHWIFGLGIGLIVILAKRPSNKSSQVLKEELALALNMEYGVLTGDKGQKSDVESPDQLGSQLNALGSQTSIPRTPFEESAILHLSKIQTLEKRSLKIRLLSLVLPAILVLVTMPQALGSFKDAITAVTNVAKAFGRGATLTIVQGASDEAVNNKPLVLQGKEPVKVELLSQNLVKIEVRGLALKDEAMTVELVRLEELDNKKSRAGIKPFQAFQLLSEKSAKGAEDEEQRSITFSVAENLALFIPSISGSKPLAVFHVKALPVPVVTLALDAKLQDPWPDDLILPLKIGVKATFPIQLLRLMIKSGQQTSQVLVANVVREDKLELALDHKLLLESYVEADFAQVEIVAEAIDHAVPKPLLGRSEPLLLNTASAYGRYREALNIIRQIKSFIDDAVEKDATSLDAQVDELAGKMMEKSDRSPFFDGLDRMQIGRFAAAIQEFKETQKIPLLHDLSQKINDFLFEHEIIDDRERDRDFFVAARSLSRLIEQPLKKRTLPLRVVEDRLVKFLDERLVRWQLRVDRLPPESVPSQFAEIKGDKIFQRAITESISIDQAAQTDPEKKSRQLTLLSKAVVDYRKWIQDLEAEEDKARSKEERERQEGLANARNVLKELQKRQGEISAEMDRAGERNATDLEQAWVGSRLKQNTNIKETKRVEAQLRSLSPTAGARVQFAIEAMEETNGAGDEGRFTDAESSADLAGRLLRQADSAAQESQQKRRSRGGRRRVTGDNYYGQSVVGGDVEIRREYEVDRRFREDILEEVSQSQVEEADRSLLEDYLRAIVR